MFVCLPYWCDQNWTHYPWNSLKSDELRGIIATLAKTAQYVLSLHGHYSITLTFSFLSTRTCKPFSKMLLFHLHIHLCWTSPCSSLLIPPVCWGPWEWPSCPLAYRSLLPRVVISKSLLIVHSATLPNLLMSVKTVSPQHQLQERLLVNSHGLKLQAIDCYSVSLMMQLLFYPPWSPCIHTIPPHLDTKDTTWKYSKSLAKAKWLPLLLPSLEEAVVV